MRIEIDTQHDSHEDIKKVIKMLQHLVGDSQEVFTNDPSAAESQISPIANIFGDASPSPQSTTTSEAAETQAQETAAETPAEASESTGRAEACKEKARYRVLLNLNNFSFLSDINDLCLANHLLYAFCLMNMAA